MYRLLLQDFEYRVPLSFRIFSGSAHASVPPEVLMIKPFWWGFVVSQVSKSRPGAPLVRGELNAQIQRQKQPRILRLRCAPLRKTFWLGIVVTQVSESRPGAPVVRGELAAKYKGIPPLRRKKVAGRGTEGW